MSQAQLRGLQQLLVVFLQVSPATIHPLPENYRFESGKRGMTAHRRETLALRKELLQLCDRFRPSPCVALAASQANRSPITVLEDWLELRGWSTAGTESDDSKSFRLGDQLVLGLYPRAERVESSLFGTVEAVEQDG